MTREEKLAQLRKFQNPMSDVLKSITMLKGDKGDKGDTPVKYVDYFTESEVSAIIDYIQSKVIPGKNGDKGDTGSTGPRGEPGKDGANGVSPDVKEIVAMVLAKVPRAKDGISPKIEDVAKQAVALINNNPDQEFVTVKQLTEFLRRGGFRGGAGSGSTTTQAVYSDTVAGTIDGINTIFTVSTAINTAFTLYLANSVYQPIVDFTYSGTTITMVTAPDSSLSGQPFWLLHN